MTASRQVCDYAVQVGEAVLGLFIASLGLSTAVAGTTLLGPAVAGHPGAMPAVKRLRYWTIYLAMFGLIGAPLALLELAAPLPLAVATLVSAVLSRGVSLFFQDTSAETEMGYLVGAEGRVLLPVGTQQGKVVVHTLADRVELPARSENGALIERGRRVLIAFVDHGVAGVVNLEPRQLTVRCPATD